MNVSTLATTITVLHDQSILNWKQGDIYFQHTADQGMRLIEENHAFNYQLWHTEDKARRDDLGFEAVYLAKRSIDTFNQQRNNRMEAIDHWLFTTLQPAPISSCPVHSETPGMMIDRLSILALKSYHMAQQATRTSADEAHRRQCHEKWLVLQEQKQQLASCLHNLLEEVQHKKRTFRLYHQFKMYNDPALNPELQHSITGQIREETR